MQRIPNEHFYKRVIVSEHKRRSAVNGRYYGVEQHYRYIPIRKTTVMNKIKKQLYSNRNKE